MTFPLESFQVLAIVELTSPTIKTQTQSVTKCKLKPNDRNVFAKSTPKHIPVGALISIH